MGLLRFIYPLLGASVVVGKGTKTSLVPLLRLLSTTAIDYIQFLHKEKKKQEEEVSTLRKDVMALKIMKV